MWRTIGIVLGTMLTLAAILLCGIALLIFIPPRSEGDPVRQVFSCEDKNHTVLCVIRGYLVPSGDRE